MSDFAMADIASLLGADGANLATKSTSRKNNTELNMEDFLKLMIVQLQSQTLDDTMDTSEMMNQMVQMQMVTAMTNMTDASVMGYAASLVNQVVTVGIVNGASLEEREIVVMGTGTMNGQQVIFGRDGNTYNLSQIMAVGKLPEHGKTEEAEKPGDETDKPVDGADGAGEAGENPEGTTTAPVEGSGESQGTQTGDAQYQGEQGAPTD